MTTRNFRVNNGISVGDVVIDAATNKITGLSTASPSADGDVVTKGYLDTRISGISSTSITSSTTNVTVAATTATVTVEGTTALTATSAGVRIHGDLTVDGEQTIVNTTVLSVEDNIIELNRNASGNATMPTLSGLKINRGETSSATEQDLYWVWDESFADDASTIFGNAGGAWTAMRATGGEAGESFPALVSGEGSLVDIRANVIHARATSAQYADIAERFAADAVMTPGAVVMFGGSQEITETAEELSEKVFGVVSTQPAYMMNSGAGNNDSHPFVAMTGRTPVRVTGIVNKGDRLVSSSVKGTARAAKTGESINPFHVIGRALESKSDAGIGLVNCFVQAKN
jgi:hypothetical protein